MYSECNVLRNLARKCFHAIVYDMQSLPDKNNTVKSPFNVSLQENLKWGNVTVVRVGWEQSNWTLNKAINLWSILNGDFTAQCCLQWSNSRSVNAINKEYLLVMCKVCHISIKHENKIWHCTAKMQTYEYHHFRYLSVSLFSKNFIYIYIFIYLFIYSPIIASEC